MKPKSKRWAEYVACIGRKNHTWFWLGNLREEITFEDSSLEEKTKLKRTFEETGQKDTGWSHLTKNRYNRQFLVSKVTIVRVAKNPKNFLTSRRTISFSR
jgi:hypothetical protein